MSKRLVLTVGNGMMGDDAAGPLLSGMMEHAPVEGWEVFDGGSAPENCMHQVREMHPDEVLIVDAAEMGLGPGEVRLLTEQVIADQFIMTTHNLPLSFLIQLIKEFVPQVTFVGIQPGTVAFACPMSLPVKQAVETIYDQLKNHGVIECVALGEEMA